MGLPVFLRNTTDIALKAAFAVFVAYLFFVYTELGRSAVFVIQQNLTFILMVVMLAIIAYFILRPMAQPAWRPAKECFHNAVKNGHLAIPPGFRTWEEVYITCRPPQKMEARGAWAFAGQVAEKGRQDTVLIHALDDNGWITNFISGAVEYGHTNFQRMERKGLKLEEGLLEAARKQIELQGAVKRAKTQAMEEAGE